MWGKLQYRVIITYIFQNLRFWYRVMALTDGYILRPVSSCYKLDFCIEQFEVENGKKMQSKVLHCFQDPQCICLRTCTFVLWICILKSHILASASNIEEIKHGYEIGKSRTYSLNGTPMHRFYIDDFIFFIFFRNEGDNHRKCSLLKTCCTIYIYNTSKILSSMSVSYIR